MPSTLSSRPPNLVAIDLGAESCRVSLLTWRADGPSIELIYRAGNAPVQRGASLHWDLRSLLQAVRHGLELCAEKATAPIAAIGVDGWAVDYVRLDDRGDPIGDPFCYRDERTVAARAKIAAACPDAFLYRGSGVQPLRINTLYQLAADAEDGVPAHCRWVNLPEFVLSRLGGRLVAELTDAAHTGLLDIRANAWNRQIFAAAELDIQAAPELVVTGTVVGRLLPPLCELGPYAETVLIAPACHDTASAVAAIPAAGHAWAYISSGTWSLVGCLLERPVDSDEALAAGFTNLRAAGGMYCFHKNVNGMWLLSQVVKQLCPGGSLWSVTELVAAAEKAVPPRASLNVDDPAFLLPGDLASAINIHLAQQGCAVIPEEPSSLPAFASLIFHSLARRYREVLHDIRRLTGQQPERIYVVGGGSRNAFLTRLTAEATGLPVSSGMVESSTVGNFSVQLAALEDKQHSPERIRHWAAMLG